MDVHDIITTSQLTAHHLHFFGAVFLNDHCTGRRWHVHGVHVRRCDFQLVTVCSLERGSPPPLRALTVMRGSEFALLSHFTLWHDRVFGATQFHAQNYLAVCAQTLVFFMFFGALVIETEILEPLALSDKDMGYALTFIVMALFVVAGGFAYRLHKQKQKQERAKV